LLFLHVVLPGNPKLLFLIVFLTQTTLGVPTPVSPIPLWQCAASFLIFFPHGEGPGGFFYDFFLTTKPLLVLHPPRFWASAPSPWPFLARLLIGGPLVFLFSLCGSSPPVSQVHVPPTVFLPIRPCKINPLLVFPQTEVWLRETASSPTPNSRFSLIWLCSWSPFVVGPWFFVAFLAFYLLSVIPLLRSPLSPFCFPSLRHVGFCPILNSCRVLNLISLPPIFSLTQFIDGDSCQRCFLPGPPSAVLPRITSSPAPFLGTIRQFFSRTSCSRLFFFCSFLICQLRVLSAAFFFFLVRVEKCRSYFSSPLLTS